MNDLTRTDQQPDWRAWTRRELDGEWVPPNTTPEMRLVAQSALNDYESRFAPSRPEVVARWLNSLGILTAGRLTVEDAKLKVGAYLSFLDYPSGCYTQFSLKRAGEKFRFWPSLAELSELLKDEMTRLHTDKHRLKILATPPKPPEPEVPVDRSDEARARWDKSLAEIVGHMKVNK